MKGHIAAVIFAAALTYCAVIASLAFAATEWLVGGESMGAPESVEASSELLIEDMSTFQKIDILCSSIFVGTVGPGAAGAINKILNLGGEEQSATNLAGLNVPALSCTVDAAGACNSPKNGELIWVFPNHLPWATTLSLVGTQWVDTIGNGGKGVPEYEMTCTTALLGVVTDSCQVTPAAIVTNETGGVSTFVEEGETVNKPGECALGGVNQELIVSPEAGLISTMTGTLTVS